MNNLDIQELKRYILRIAKNKAIDRRKTVGGLILGDNNLQNVGTVCCLGLNC